MGLAVALQFLTAIPLRREASAGGMGRALPYFPLVGLLIGGLLLGLDRLLELAFPAGLVNILLIVALVVVTRALHVDGFIDTCDGLAGGSSAASRLEIMRDSRVGSFGVIGALLLILLLYAALSLLPEEHRLAALVLAPAISRWTMVYAIVAYPYARKREGLGTSFRDQATLSRTAIATALTLAACGGLMRLEGLAVMAGAWLVAAAVAWYLNTRLGGLTGDTYGAINEVVQVAVLALIPLITWSYAL